MNEDFPPSESSDPSPPDACLESTELIPTHIGRFRIEAILGKGGFGVVYLGHDEQLQRKVAERWHGDQRTSSFGQHKNNKRG